MSTELDEAASSTSSSHTDYFSRSGKWTISFDNRTVTLNARQLRMHTDRTLGFYDEAGGLVLVVNGLNWQCWAEHMEVGSTTQTIKSSTTASQEAR